MAQDRTHKGRVDFGDGLLMEPQAEPAAQAHGTQLYTSGIAGDVYAKTAAGIVHQITPTGTSGLNFTEKQVLVGGPGGVGIQSSELVVDYVEVNEVTLHANDGRDFEVASTQEAGAGDGPDLSLRAAGGTSFGAASGGNATLNAGGNTGNGGTPGYAEMVGGPSQDVFTRPGAARVFGGRASFAGGLSRGGPVYIRGGVHTSSGTGGHVHIGDNHTSRIFVGGLQNDEGIGVHIAESLSGTQVAGYGHHWTQNAGAGSVPNRGAFRDDQGVDMYTGARRNFARAYVSGIAQIANGTWTGLPLPVESFDLESTLDADIDPARFQPNVPGYYQINWNVSYTLDSGSAEVHPWLSTAPAQMFFHSAIYKNGSEHSKGSTDSFNATKNEESIDEYPASHGSAEVYLNGTTDYIELYAWQFNSSGYAARIIPRQAASYMDCHLVNVR